MSAPIMMTIAVHITVRVRNCRVRNESQLLKLDARAVAAAGVIRLRPPTSALDHEEDAVGAGAEGQKCGKAMGAMLCRNTDIIWKVASSNGYGRRGSNKSRSWNGSSWRSSSTSLPRLIPQWSSLAQMTP